MINGVRRVDFHNLPPIDYGGLYGVLPGESDFSGAIKRALAKMNNNNNNKNSKKQKDYE